MQSPQLKKFILKHSDLFWFTPQFKKTDISDAAVVETILNYGDKEAVVELINCIGIKKVAAIYYKATSSSNRAKNNYSELTINFFNHVFKKYVQ